MVVAFGGDGTVNEAANGLVGSDTPLCCLPGGRANVYCRMLGIPSDVVDATEHLLGMAYDWKPRRVDVGRVNDRYFTFSAGVGLDASVVEVVDAHPRLKARMGEWYYTWAAVKTFNRRYLVRPLRLRAQIGGESIDGVTAIVQNAHPYTYFGDRAGGWPRAPRSTAATWPALSCAGPTLSTSPRSDGGRCRGARTWSATATSTATAG